MIFNEFFFHFQCLCAVLLFIAAVLNITLTQVVYLTLIFGETLLAGIIYGINHVTVICHASDTSAREIRGTVVRTIAYTKWLIVLCASWTFYIGYPTHVTFLFIGLVYIVVSLLVLLTTFCFVFNSFVHSLEQQKENEDTIKLRFARIRGDPTHLRRIQTAFDELKLQLNEDQADGTNILGNGNVRPLILVGIARLLSVLINNIPILVILNSWLSVSIEQIDPDRIFFAVSVVLTINLAAKWIIGLIGIFIGDCIDLNRFYYVAASIWSVLIIILHIQSFVYLNLVILLLYWIIGLGVDAISYNQLSEVFPLTKRAASIASIQILEAIVEVIILGVYLLAFPQLLVIALVIPIILCSLILFKLLPNTHGRSLRDARDLINTAIVRNANHKYELTPLNGHE